MNKILLIPLDERPCNYDFPQMLAAGSDCQLMVPPREILGKKKQAGDVDAIWKWLVDNIEDCSNAIISIDTLLYSGIVPSRLHYYSSDVLIKRLNKLREIKKLRPDICLYAFNLIMRNPSYSSSDEEPDYYGQWGRQIHRYGYLTHKKELGIADDAELSELEDINRELPEKYLKDYYDRRKINLEINKEVIKLASDNVLDFVIIPQDDASPYGVTAKDQQIIRSRIDDLKVNFKVYMYPDADAVANTLLARVINKIHNRRPFVYVKYASSIGGGVIPLYEDRIVSETIKYQILAAGGLTASSADEADIILMINVPGGEMQDRLQEPDPVNGEIIRHTIQYDAFRNLIEMLEYAEYEIEYKHKDVIFGDIAYGNGGDDHLFSLLQQKKLLWKLAGYAGWNTSSNTLGTCIPMGMLHHIFGTTKESLKFLSLRYLEDIAYSVFVRRDVTDNDLEKLGLTEEKLDGQRGKVSEIVLRKLQEFADSNLSDERYSVVVKDCYMPWSRMFEAGIKTDVILK